MKILDWAGDVFRWAAGAVVPMFARPVSPVGLAWFVHSLLLTATAIGLYYAQPHVGITANIGRGPPWFRPFWLPVLFLLAYALTWSAVWVWRLLAPNQPYTDFPELDATWAEIVSTLEKAGIGLADTPVFLVFGGHANGLDPVFRALPGGAVVNGAPGPGAPLQAYANRDGIYLAVPGASVLGAQDQMDALAGPTDGGDSMALDASIGIGQSVGLGASVAMGASIGYGGSIGYGQSVGFGESVGFGNTGAGAGRALREIQKIIARAREEGRPPTEDEKRRIRELSGDTGGGSRGGGVSPSAKAAPRSVLQNPQLVADAEARLVHVCGLIAASRWPLCPVNGAVLAVPAAIAERDDAAQQWGLVARQDLSVAEAGLRLRFPVFALVGGVEDMPGGQVFFARFAAEKGKERLGKSFPLNPDLRPEDVPAAVESAAGWVFGNLLPYQIYRQMRVDGSGGPAGDTRDNADQVRFLAALRRRGPNLARLVGRAVMPGPDRTPVYGGCYLSVVQRDEPTEAKFARPFFQKVASTQGYVAWTEDAYATEAAYRTRTRLGYAALLLWLAAVIGFAGYVGYVKWGR